MEVNIAMCLLTILNPNILQSQFNNKNYVTLDGMNHKARFGLSVACAGNLNLDGLSVGNKRGIEV